MKSRLHRRALLRWMAATGISLPILLRAPLAAEPPAATQSLQAFLDTYLQRLFPHPELDTSVYTEIATVMAGAIEANPALDELVAAGRIDLDAGDTLWLELDESQQRAALQDIEPTAFFQALRALGGLLFYNTPAVWRVIGYEGSSFEKGGYLSRGFDDIDWLPEVINED